MAWLENQGRTRVSEPPRPFGNLVWQPQARYSPERIRSRSESQRFGLTPLPHRGYHAPTWSKRRKIRFIALTLGEGKPLESDAYEQEFGCRFADEFPAAIGRLRAAGLIDESAGQFFLTSRGGLVYDLVTLAFYSQPTQQWLNERYQKALIRFGSPSASTR